MSEFDGGATPSYEAASESVVAELDNSQPTAGAGEGTPQAGIEDSSGQSGQANPQQASDFNPQTWALNYRGQTVFPKDRDHLVNLAQKGWSYSQSMEEVNKTRAELDAKKERYAQLEQAAELLEQHPVLNQRFTQLVQEYKSNGNKFPEQAAAQQMSNEQSSPQLKQALDKIAELEGKLGQFDSRFQMIDSEKADAEVRAEMDAVVKNHPEADWKVDSGDGSLALRVMQLAHKYEGRISLEEAYKLLTYDNLRTNVEAEALKRAKEEKERQTKNGIVTTTSGTKPPAQKTQPRSYNEAAVAALSEFGG